MAYPVHPEDLGVVARMVGRKARSEEEAIDACPYGADTYQAKCWRVGWREEDAELGAPPLPSAETEPPATETEGDADDSTEGRDRCAGCETILTAYEPGPLCVPCERLRKAEGR